MNIQWVKEDREEGTRSQSQKRMVIGHELRCLMNIQWVEEDRGEGTRSQSQGRIVSGKLVINIYKLMNS